MEHEITRLKEQIALRQGTLYSFEGIKLQAYEDERDIELTTEKPISFLDTQYMYNNDNNKIVYRIPLTDLDVYESLLIHALSSRRMFCVYTNEILTQVAKYYVGNEYNGLEYIIYYPGRIVWLYKDEHVMSECDFDMYLEIIKGMYYGLTTTQNVWKNKHMLYYGDVLNFGR